MAEIRRPTIVTRPAIATATPTTVVRKPGVVATVGGNANVTAGSKVLSPIRPPAFQIASASERVRHLKFLIYANYGVGKTLLAGSSSQVKQMQDVLIISAESGDLTLLGYSGVDVAVAKDYATVARIQEFLRRHCKYRDSNDEQRLREEQNKFRGEGGELRRYQTVIIDSLTEVEQYCLYQLLGITENTGLDEDVASEEWSEYKKNTSMIQRLVRSFRDLPMHVIFTCSASYVQDEKKRKTFAPMLTGKLSSKVQGFMDLVGYLTVEPTDKDQANPRRLWIQPSASGRYEAKSRFTNYKGRYIDIPDVDVGPPGMEVILKTVGLWESPSGTQVSKPTNTK
jgi:hypothetical protein